MTKKSIKIQFCVFKYLDNKCMIVKSLEILQKKNFFGMPYCISDELIAEKEKYREIGDDLDCAFVELILNEK